MQRKLYLLVIILITTFTTTKVLAQTTGPDGVIFQAVATDQQGNPAANRTIYIKDAILQTTATGTVVYSETFQVTASSTGVFTIVIGKGQRLSGPTSIASLDWSAGPYFLNLKAAVAPSLPLTNWNVDQQYVDMGTSQFWTVPFALFASKVAGFDLKLNNADTTNMLKPYLRKSDTASTSTKGVLTSTDWNTFNSKQPAGAYLTTISGIAAGGDLSGTYTNPTVLNSAVIDKVLTGYVSGAGTIASTDNILQAIQKLNGNVGALVTNVGGTGTVSGLTLAGTVTTTGNLTLGGTLAVTASNFASQLANTVLAAPNGLAGIPTFRTVVAADIPTLNQNTTGNAATATNISGGVAGSIPYQTGAGSTSLLAAGSSGQILTLSGTTPTWTTPSSEIIHTIGESYGGGKVFYISTDGLHGLIAETQDQSNMAYWYDAQNMISMSSKHSTEGKKYTDWRLPTQIELDLLYLQKSVVGGFTIQKYWSSTEYGYTTAWSKDFNNGNIWYNDKYNPFYVRAIRAF